jgi:hypothetical protein
MMLVGDVYANYLPYGKRIRYGWCLLSNTKTQKRAINPIEYIQNTQIYTNNIPLFPL